MELNLEQCEVKRKKVENFSFFKGLGERGKKLKS